MTKMVRMKSPGERVQIGSLLDPELYRRAKALAALQKRNTGEVIDDALREYLSKHGMGPDEKS
jgi:Xaa-Pro aminopeptidase